jgi:alanyl-tRNA synthetase
MWLEFFKNHGHAEIPGASVLPENDPSTLFISAGMQPLVPFLLGEKHPQGARLTNIQRCIRTGDIDEVGDDSHLTFFEMLGAWSLGDYFKAERTAWSYEFLTSPKYLNIPKDRIHVTCFAGGSAAQKDTECAEFWRKLGVKDDKIHFLPAEDNWWGMPSGLGPQGPCSEMFFCDDAGKHTELGNDVYMQYIGEKTQNGVKISLAKQKNVDTGWGLERILCFVNGHKSVYETELFAPAIDIIKTNLPKISTRDARIIAEHLRAACVIIADGICPSNTGAGYVLRRLIRRLVRVTNKYSTNFEFVNTVTPTFCEYLAIDPYKIGLELTKEIQKFFKTLQKGEQEFNKIAKKIDGETAFFLYETYGFPIELTVEMAAERGISVDLNAFEKAKNAHAEKSRNASATAGIFKGGLANTGDETVKLHTAAHILLAVLRKNFGETVTQKGSNITPERLRFDFAFNRKLEAAELEKIEAEVNEIIMRKLEISFVEMPIEEAKKSNATGAFWDKYGAVVKVYSIGAPAVSREICGGPHVKNTGELGVFKIQKEEAVSAGVRRIKAVLE